MVARRMSPPCLSSFSTDWIQATTVTMYNEILGYFPRTEDGHANTETTPVVSKTHGRTPSTPPCLSPFSFPFPFLPLPPRRFVRRARHVLTTPSPGFVGRMRASYVVVLYQKKRATYCL